ncbi:hypothetical protein UA08_02983 [Talaromyces atroroseus]|uniref:Integral membrane protein n=1 Tax=Talaromyces atroroseus TaxID=1441469 RepID=A0A225AJK6_TALAT|nr:hypothetical protein UA08_02983 [Talaromyces atroroseus]OKL61682.1 hypothetical protein UA08_02983 [Talaromyces atroroseus]
MALSRQRALDAHLLEPVLRAYGLGYLALTTPRLLGCLPLLLKNDTGYRVKLERLCRILLSGLGLNKFSTFCAVLVGGATWLPLLFFRITSVHSSFRSSLRSVRIVRFVSAFVSAWAAFNLLNRKSRKNDTTITDSARDEDPKGEEDRFNGLKTERLRPELSGRSLDFTLFSLTRAAGVIAAIAWNGWEKRRKSRGRWSRTEELAPRIADAGLFAGSAAVVMWAWFYSPERLPRSYEKWIGEAAQVDDRLIEALRRARRGEFIYGKDTGQAPLLESMCKDYGWPVEWGDPAATVPIPCEMVHMGCGSSCEWHAVSRFMRSFKFALLTNLPLQVLLRVRSKQPVVAINRAIRDATRSSSFLALFISMFYYSVCLARTRLGPKLLSSKLVTPLMWDSGLCVGAGCLMCGWSILAESIPRRQEIALFVAPRAAATVLPRRYDRKSNKAPYI